MILEFVAIFMQTNGHESKEKCPTIYSQIKESASIVLFFMQCYDQRSMNYVLHTTSQFTWKRPLSMISYSPTHSILKLVNMKLPEAERNSAKREKNGTALCKIICL